MVVEGVLMMSAGILVFIFVILFVLLITKPSPKKYRGASKELNQIKNQINGDEEAW